MKIVQTFWTRDVSGDALLNISAGWLSPEYHWMSWALSCLLLKKHFGRVTLSTDPRGAELLADRFGLPYDEVLTGLGKAIAHQPPELWALGKIYTYMQQREPFLHFDGDFFLFNPLQPSLLNAPIVCQNLEKNLFFYRDTIEEINKYLPYVPEPCLPATVNAGDVLSCNAGIIGGTDLSFFREYGEYAFAFANRNKDYSQFANASNLNFVFEQYFIHWLAVQKNIPVSYLSSMVQEDPAYATYANFNNIPGSDFIHPVGGHKKNPGLCGHVASVLQSDYPEYYERILRTLKDGRVKTFIRWFGPASEIHASTNPFYEHASTAFRSTLAALDYLDGVAGNSSDVSLIREAITSPPDTTPGPAVSDLVNSSGFTDRLQETFLDLYQYETYKKEMYETLIRAEDASSLAMQRLHQYQAVRESFFLPMVLLNQRPVVLNEYARIVEVSQNWICRIPELTGEMIRDKFESGGRLDSEIALLPRFSLLVIEEHYLEPLDGLMIGHCDNPITIGGLINEMKQYFSAEQVSDHYQQFEGLMVNTIKRLLYIGILSFANVSGA